MKIYNLNIRGLGGGTKGRYLKRCFSVEEVEFACLQETKTAEVTDTKIFRYGGITMWDGFIMEGLTAVVVFFRCGTKRLLSSRVTLWVQVT